MKEILELLSTHEIVDLLFSGKGGEKSFVLAEILNDRIAGAVKKTEVPF